MGNISPRSGVAHGRNWHPWVSAIALAFSFGLALLAVTSHARAAAPSLKWKFTKGESLHYLMDQKTITEAKLQGQNIKTTVTQKIDSTWSITAVDANGSADMAQTIDRLRTKIESPFGMIEYDSNDKKAPEGPIAAGVVPRLKVLVGATFKYKMSPHGELSDVRVPDGLLKSLKEAGTTGTNVGIFTEDGLKNMIHESSLVLPTEPLEKPWTRQIKIPSPPIGTMVLDKTYTYEGTEDGAEKIGMALKVSLKPDSDSKLEIKIVKQDGKGSFLFDNTAGYVKRSLVTQKVEMQIKLMNNEVAQNTETSTAMELVKVDQGGAK
jgi:hypothetical protein